MSHPLLPTLPSQSRQLTEQEYLNELWYLVPNSNPLAVDAGLAECAEEFSAFFVREAKACLKSVRKDILNLTTNLQAYDALLPDGLTTRAGRPLPEPDYIAANRARHGTLTGLQGLLTQFLDPGHNDPLLDKLVYLSLMLREAPFELVISLYQSDTNEILTSDRMGAAQSLPARVQPRSHSHPRRPSMQ